MGQINKVSTGRVRLIVWSEGCVTVSKLTAVISFWYLMWRVQKSRELKCFANSCIYTNHQASVCSCFLKMKNINWQLNWLYRYVYFIRLTDSRTEHHNLISGAEFIFIYCSNTLLRATLFDCWYQTALGHWPK